MDFSPEADKKLDDMLKDMLTKQYLKGMKQELMRQAKRFMIN